MQSNWERIFQWCLIHEGGFANHPRDPGGATNKGVTQRVYDAYRRGIGQPTRSVRKITDDEVRTIYRTQYWDRVQGDRLPDGVDYAVYDFAVNSGVSRAAKYLQRQVGVEPDGDIGQITLDAVRKFDPEGLVIELCRARMAFLRRLKHWSTFGRGWTRRVMGDQDGFQETDIGVIDRAVMLARSRPNIPDPVPRDDGAAKGDGEEKVRATLADALKDPKALVPAATAAGGVLTAAKEIDGPLAWALAAAVVIVVIGGIVWLMRGRR